MASAVGPTAFWRHSGIGAGRLAESLDGPNKIIEALSTNRRVIELCDEILRRGLDTDEILARFRRERQILAALDHPGIARLIDGGATADFFYGPPERS